MLLRHTTADVMERSALTINPAKTCQPIGAMYAALGVHNCLPHSHGSQGCCSYHRSTLTRHYKEPVMAGTSSFTEGSAVFGGQAKKLLQTRAVGIQTAALLQQFFAVAAFVETIRQCSDRLDQPGQRGVEPRFGKTLFLHPDNRLTVEQVVAEEPEELLGGLEGVLDELFFPRAAEPVEQAALLGWIPQVFQQAVGAKAGQVQSKVVGGDLRHGVPLVEDNEIVGKQDATRAAFFRGATGAQVGEEEAVVNDDDLGVAEAGARPLVETWLAAAMLVAARGRIGVDRLPDVG